MKRNSLKLSDMTKIALCSTLLSISSYLIIPVPFTPIVFSLHTVVVNLTALILTCRQSIYTIIIYLLMGLIGLPVFAGGSAGADKLFGLTGGFYFGFLFSVIAINLLKGDGKFLRYFLVTVGVGIPIQHFLAIIFMCFYNGFNLKLAVMTVSLPFLVTDIIKCAIASLLAISLNKALYIKAKSD